MKAFGVSWQFFSSCTKKIPWSGSFVSTSIDLGADHLLLETSNGFGPCYESTLLVGHSDTRVCFVSDPCRSEYSFSVR
jgi:hypothetical protein